MNIWFSTIPLSILGAWLYQRGGTSSGTLWRDLGIPSCVAAYFLITGHWHTVLILCFGLIWGAQTTYFKKSGESAVFFNWICVGLAFSLALLPYAYATGNWGGFGLRTLIVTGFTAAWSELVGWDILEEFGRGWIQIATLPLLLIGG